ncbi:hypothetical protein [Roseibium sp. RKSG952]|uniref:hypothetical protein n=1 Tax=Roseibium sp. RKSG952 TaxID=2529384 RepID=UPI0013C7C415|nr:hypothetical protein [Roseibium sp. RKSG952]MTH96977.1 hypothetical protein [Roseibium sp. RKSG952]
MALHFRTAFFLLLRWHHDAIRAKHILDTLPGYFYLIKPAFRADVEQAVAKAHWVAAGVCAPVRKATTPLPLLDASPSFVNWPDRAKPFPTAFL